MRQGLGLASALLGAITVITGGDYGSLLRIGLNEGDFVMLGAVAVMALYTLLLRGLPQGISPLSLHTTSTAAAVVLMVPLYLWRLYEGERLVLNAPSLLGIGYAATFSSVAAFSPGHVG